MTKSIITMAHGSGGAATQELIRKLFQKQLANTYLNKMDDAAVLPGSTYPLSMTTDSFVVNPLFFPGGDIGKLAVYGTVNDLWMMGGQPLYLTVAFIMEEGLSVEILEEVVCSLGEAAREIGVQVVAGDTKVVEGQGGLYINTTGLGQMCYSQVIGSAQAKPGDSVIVSGPLGNHHASILSSRLGIQNNIKSDCAYLGNMVKDLLEAGLEVHVLRDVTRGGLATVLNEIAESANVNIRISEELIPVDTEVQGFCQILGLDPLYMANEGKFVCILPERETPKALSIIKKHRHGSDAAVLGTVFNSQQGEGVTMRTKYGGERIIDILHGEGLPRIC